MKNLLTFLFCLSLFFMVACGGGASSGGDGAATTTTTSTSGGSTSIGGIDIPSFSDSKLTDYATAYAKYIEKYEKAYKEMKKGNAQAFNDLSQEGQDLATKASQINQGVSEADAAKLNKFMEKVTSRMTSIASGQ